MAKRMDERNREIIDLYESGLSYQEIANRHGISKQRAYNIVYSYLYRRKESDIEKQVSKVIYPNIKRWMIETETSIKYLAELVYKDTAYYVAIYRFLTDKTVRMNVETIKMILDVTGMTFEKAFSLVESD